MQISVIIPCLNEERTVGACIDKARKGIDALGAEGEILVVDNGSTDNTRKNALEHGARIIDAGQRGYGNAVRQGIASALGAYLFIGDGDDSYDFSTLPLFMAKAEGEDLDLVIGNRFTGSIEQGAMPFLNRYFGNPLLSAIGRILYGNVCGDFHCGLRLAKRQALISLNLSSQKMEMATEMIIRASKHELKIGEVPITLYRDGRGRPPHLRRWRDGLTNLLFMIQYRFSKDAGIGK